MASGPRNMDVGRGIAEVLSQSEVNEIYLTVESNHEVIWLDVTMDIITSMKAFQGP